MATRTTREQEVIKRARGEIEKRTGKTLEEIYQEREKRVTDVIQMKVPDRMPVFLRLGAFPLRYAGLPQSAVFYDPAAYREAMIKTLIDFEPDIVQLRSLTMPSGFALETLGSIQNKWPGGNLPPDVLPQHRDAEIMKDEEYDLFLADPGDYVLRYYLPRVWKSLEPLSKLPPLRSLVGYVSMATQSIRFSSPEIIQAFEAIVKAGQEEEKFAQEKVTGEVASSLGIPPITYPGRSASAPFDVITDDFRGMRATAVDMFKRPEKLFAAMEKLLELQRVMAVPADPKDRGRRRVGGGGGHWGDQAYLSKKQFETFYWPSWKKSLLATIDLGYVPVMHPEGQYIDRVEHLLELPKGNSLLYNEILDVVKAKEILGGHLAFMGGVPAALLHFGSPQEVDECCKKLIEVCGKGGGYILSAAAVGEEDAKPENLKAMVDAVRKYGRY